MTIEEVQAGIRKLPIAEAWRLAAWLDEYLNDAWDEQMKADAESGRLDRAFAKELAEIKANQLRNE
ncbi:MAG: hypothetical protein RLZZ511_2001 [Cyanobacteriota bacterium]|jgi:hypothetical protein